MARLSRRETETRLRKMARAQVDMEQGVYEWPDGRNPVRPDGTPVIVKAELVRVGGYSDFRTGKQKVWFEDPYYKRQLAMERARRQQNLPAVIEENPINLLTLGRRMIDEALIRLENDPDSFSTSTLVTAGPQIVKVGLEIAARERDAREERENRPTRIDQLNAYINSTLVEMSPDEREQLLDTKERAAEERMSKLQEMIDAIQVREEDEVGDVIDAEIDTEPS